MNSEINNVSENVEKEIINNSKILMEKDDISEEEIIQFYKQYMPQISNPEYLFKK